MKKDKEEAIKLIKKKINNETYLSYDEISKKLKNVVKFNY